MFIGFYTGMYMDETVARGSSIEEIVSSLEKDIGERISIDNIAFFKAELIRVTQEINYHIED